MGHYKNTLDGIRKTLLKGLKWGVFLNLNPQICQKNNNWYFWFSICKKQNKKWIAGVYQTNQY